MNNKHINKIANGTVIDYWYNDKKGKFEDLNNNFKLRFIKMDSPTTLELPYSRWSEIPIIASGFIVFLIKNWGKKTEVLFNDYLKMKFQEFKNKHALDADAWKRDFENEFNKIHLKEEKFNLSESQKILEYINPEERELLSSYIVNYLDFVSQFEKENPIPNHFSREFNSDELTSLFNSLISSQSSIIDKDTDFNSFCFRLSGQVNEKNDCTYNKINWRKSSALLAYFIDNLFADTNQHNYWKLTEEIFLVSGKIPNRDHLKNSIAKYKNYSINKPKGFQIIDQILTNL